MLLQMKTDYNTHFQKIVIKAIDSWNEKFGKHYHKLRISYNFLRNKKNVDFKKLIAQTNFERKEMEKRLKQEKMIAEHTVSKIISRFEMQIDSFRDCIFEANTCFDLLSPDAAFNVFPKDSDNEGKPSKMDKFSKNKAKAPLITVTVDHSKKLVIKESPDNTSVIQVLDDRIHQAEKSFIPRIDSWIEELIKNNGEQNEVLPLIKMKERLNIVCNKYNRLEIQRTAKRKRRIVQKNAGDSDDSDFEEVDDDDVLDTIPEEKKLKLAMELSTDLLLPKSSTATKIVSDDEQPCTSSSILKKTSDTDPVVKPLKKSSKMKEIIRSDAELDESDMALQQYALARFESLHRFWAPKDVEVEEIDMDRVRALNPNYCNVPGKFEPVTWACRAPMKSGKTCPRMDRFKCPLHGKVIPRDKDGKPNGKSGEIFSKSELLSTKKSNGESWEEVEKEVEKVTGEQLNYSKIKKKREVKPTNLVNINKPPPATPRNRIEKKILNPKAIRSVNKNAEKMEDRKNKSVFGQQFNYAM